METWLVEALPRIDSGLVRGIYEQNTAVGEFVAAAARGATGAARGARGERREA